MKYIKRNLEQEIKHYSCDDTAIRFVKLDSENKSLKDLKNEYPVGIDFVWVALDKNNRPAIFITAGEGFIPDSDIKKGSFEEVIGDLPVVSTPVLFETIDIGNHESFFNLCSYGFYVYDWYFKKNNVPAHYRKICVPQDCLCDIKNIPAPFDKFTILENCDFLSLEKYFFD